ncbi:MAG TPA: DNA methyltransferase, partial [Acidimicrobiales bacterium]|nr:DNA methyltransferase [Acidimicrobiales bacterium]
DALLDTALDPLLDRAESEPDHEAALLSLTVCDPACGSGHFLVAAGRRIASRVAAVRADGAEPTIEQMHEAMHDVAARCLYGVDVNPMAAELAKVSLWLEGMQPGRALSLLDGHIKDGNALLGTTPTLLAGGIPDEAFIPIEGDDRRTATALRNRNRAEQSGQGRFGENLTITVGALDLATEVAAIEGLVPQNLADVHIAAQRLRRLDTSPEARRARLLADAWCSAFVLPKTPGAPVVTQGSLIALHDGSASPDLVEAVESVAAQYRWFHWQIEFPHIFSLSDSDSDRIHGWVGGFDCVIGNPPWERIKLQEQEWFASRMPAIAEARNAAARRTLITALATERPELHKEFLTDRRQAEGESHFIRNSGRYPLTGRGDINTYAPFAETDRALLGSSGHMGVILPTGIATDATTQYFFKDLVTSKALVSLYDFENSLPLFEAVHRGMKFCLLTLTGRGAPADEIQLAFFAHQPDDLKRDGMRFTLTPQEITQLNPNSGTCPVFRTRRDAEITLDIYRRHPVLIRTDDPDGNPWGLSFMTMFHMSNDSELFRTREQLEDQGWALDGNVFRRNDEVMLPLYQGVMTDFYDHRSADVIRSGTAVVRQNQPSYISDEEKCDPYRFAMPIYWVPQSDVEDALAARWTRVWLGGFSSITSPTNERSMTPCLLPRVAVGNSTPLVLAERHPAVLVAILSSIALDYVVRQKLGGTNMNYIHVEQLAVPNPGTFDRRDPWTGPETLAEWTQTRVAELAFTAWDIAPLARDLGISGPPFIWDTKRRAVLRAELDAAALHLYGIGRDNTKHVLSTFPIANRRDPELISRVLDAYDRIAESIEAGVLFESTLDPAPGFGPRHEERT